MTNFQQTSYAQVVLFGVGAIAQLPEMLERFGWARVLLITTGSAQRSGRAAAVTALLGERAVGVYAETESHVPAAQVAAVSELAAAANVDALLALGGGS